MGFYGHRFGYAGDGIVGDVGFDSSYADSFWRRDGNPGPSYPFAASYTIPRGLVDAAKAQWQVLQDIIDFGSPDAGAAQATMDRLRTNVSSYVQNIEAMVKQRYDFERDSQAAESAATYYREINGELQRFVSKTWADPVEAIDASRAAATAASAKQAADAANADAIAKKAAAAAATAKANREQTQSAIAAAQVAVAQAEQARVAAQSAQAVKSQAAAVAAQKGGSSPLLIAAIAVPAVIAAFFALRSRKSVGGYKRRRR